MTDTTPQTTTPKTASAQPQQDPTMTRKAKPLETLLAEHSRLTAEIAEIDRQLSVVSDARVDAERALRAAHDDENKATGRVEQRLSRLSAHNREERLADGINALNADPAVIEARERAADAKRRIKEADDRDRALSEQRRALEHERFNLEGAPSIADLLAIQRQIDETHTQIGTLEHLLEQRQAEVREARQKLPDLAGIERELSALMVRVELGEADKRELAPLEKRRAAAIKARDQAGEQAKQAALLAKGVEERLQRLRETLAELETSGRLSIAWHARADLEQAARAFREQAEQAFKAHGRMTGLVRLIEQTGAPIARDVAERFGAALRSDFNVSGHDGLSLRDDRTRRQQAHTDELERLHAAGVRLLG